MILQLTTGLAFDPELVTEMSFKKSEGEVKIRLSSGRSWTVARCNQRNFNKYVRIVNKALEGLAK